METLSSIIDILRAHPLSWTLLIQIFIIPFYLTLKFLDIDEEIVINFIENYPTVFNIVGVIYSSIIYLVIGLIVYFLKKDKGIKELIELGLYTKIQKVSKSANGESITNEQIIPYPCYEKDGVLYIQNLGKHTVEDIEKLLPNLSSIFSRKKGSEVEFGLVKQIYKSSFFNKETWFAISESKFPDFVKYDHEDCQPGKFYLGIDQFGEKVYTEQHTSKHCLMFLGVGGSGKSEAAKNCLEDFKKNFPDAKLYIVSAKPPIEDYWYMLSHPDVTYYNPTKDMDEIIEKLEQMFSEYQAGCPSDAFKKAIWLFDECGQYLVKKAGEDKETATKRAKMCQLVQSHAELNRYTGIPMILCNQKQDADALAVDKGLIHYIFTGKTKTPQMSQQLLGSPIAYNPKYHKGLLAGCDDDGNVLSVKFRYLDDVSKSVLFTRPQGSVLEEILRTKGRDNSAYTKCKKYFPDLDEKKEQPVEKIEIEETKEEAERKTPFHPTLEAPSTDPEETPAEPVSQEKILKPQNDDVIRGEAVPKKSQFKIISEKLPAKKKYSQTHVVLEVLNEMTGEILELLMKKDFNDNDLQKKLAKLSQK